MVLVSQMGKLRHKRGVTYSNHAQCLVRGLLPARYCVRLWVKVAAGMDTVPALGELGRGDK